MNSSPGVIEESPIVVPWYIRKARTVDGVMEWEATTSKFNRDQQGDLVTPQFYNTAISRFKSGAMPPPFFSVAHYPSQDICECGAQFKSLAEQKCTVCGRDRLLAGIATDMWISGKQPMAKGFFYDNELGRETYKACRDDIERKVPYDESVRVSMGFYPDPNGVLYPAPGQRDFVSGWVEHFAGTRVPVVPEAALTVKSLSIKTRYDDAAAVVRSTALADKLSKLTGRRLKSDVDDELIIKSEEEDGGQESSETEFNQDDYQEDKSQTAEEDVPDSEMIEKMYEKSGSMIDDELMREAHESLGMVMKAISAPGGNKAQILSLAANLVSAIRDYAHTLVDNTVGTDAIGAGPVGPNGMPLAVNPTDPLADPNNQMPPNQPTPPAGAVYDQTTDPTKLTAPTDANNPNLPPDLNDPNGPPTTTQDLLAEPVDPNAPVKNEDPNALPPIPMPADYTNQTAIDQTQTVGGKEVVPADKQSADGTPPSDTTNQDQTTDPNAVDPNAPVDQNVKPAKKKLKFGKKAPPVAKSVRLTDLMYKHLPGQHDQQSHAGVAYDALSAMQKSGPKTKGAVQAAARIRKQFKQAKELPLEDATVESINSAEEAMSAWFDQPMPDLLMSPPERDQYSFMMKRVKTAIRDLESDDNLLMDNYNKSKTSVGERVKERARPNAAVKSAAEHPAEVFMQVWASGVTSVLTNSQLTRQQKLEAVSKHLLEFKPGVMNLIEETTPVTNVDVDAYVKSAVEEAVSKTKAQHDAEMLQLQAKVEALTRSVVNANVQQVIKSVTGKGRLQRKSFSQPQFAPAAPTTAPNGAPVLSGDSQPIRKATAAEAAAASVAAGPTMLFRY